MFTAGESQSWDLNPDRQARVSRISGFTCTSSEEGDPGGHLLGYLTTGGSPFVFFSMPRLTSVSPNFSTLPPRLRCPQCCGVFCPCSPPPTPRGRSSEPQGPAALQSPHIPPGLTAFTRGYSPYPRRLCCLWAGSSSQSQSGAVESQAFLDFSKSFMPAPPTPTLPALRLLKAQPTVSEFNGK